MISRKREGHPLPDTPEMQLWRKEFEKMKPEEHKAKLKMLGLTDEEAEEIMQGEATKEIEELTKEKEAELKNEDKEKKTKEK